MGYLVNGFTSKEKGKLMRKLVIAIAAAPLLLWACSGTSESPQPTMSDSGPRVIDVSVAEWEFTPGLFAVEAGETVTFVATNEGQIDHEFEIVANLEDALAHHDHDTDHGGSDADGEVLKLALTPGESGELTVTFDEAGDWYIVCLLPGHYEAGMVAQIDVG